MSSTSPDSTCAMRRRTSASCALVISGEISRAQFSTSRSVSSARASGGNVIASRKISSDVAMGKEYLVVVVRGKNSATYFDYVAQQVNRSRRALTSGQGL